MRRMAIIPSHPAGRFCGPDAGDVEVTVSLDDDSGPIRLRRLFLVALVVSGVAALSALSSLPTQLGLETRGQVWAATPADTGDAPSFQALLSAAAEHMPINVTVGILLLLAFSAFFSASEVAFFSIHQVRLRGMRAEADFLGRMVANLMQRPGRLLTTILIGNMIVNILISIMLPPRLERIIEAGFGTPPSISYVLTVCISTVILVFFGEVTPKVFAVRIGEIYARVTVVPLRAVDWALTPARWSAVKVTEFLFRVTRFDKIQPAPFITDKEFLSVLSDSEAQGVIEQEEGQMMQGILESGDAYVREILVPRPNIVSISYGASVGEARELFRKHEYSRMPVHDEDLDHIKGVLVIKDLLQSIAEGRLDEKIGPLARPANFVPETMTLREFVKDAQRKRMHLSIVVDEYGGTEGIATLEDAIEEVVGDIRDEEERESKLYKKLGKGSYVVDGSLPLDEFCDLIGIDLEDNEHETVAGFFIDHTKKIPQKGDHLSYNDIEFTVDEVDGKRASSLHVRVLREAEQERMG